MASCFVAGRGVVVVTGALAVLLDLLMEPAMTRQGYWRWSSPGGFLGGAPIENFVAWFVLACLGGWVLFAKRLVVERGVLAVWVGQAVLMVCLWVT